MRRLFPRWVPGLLLVLLLGMTGATMAAEPSLEITPFVGYRMGGQFKDGTGAKLDLNDHSSVALAFNWRAAEPGSQYELLYSRQATQTEGNTPIPFKVEYLHIGGTTPLGELNGRVVPFAAGGIGAARFSPGAGLSQETRWSMNLGGGVRIPLAKQVRLRFEARGHLTWLGSNPELFCTGPCAVTGKRSTFFQYEALGGVSVSF